MIAWKRTNRCIIMDKVGHNAKMTITTAFDTGYDMTWCRQLMNSLKDSLSLSQKDLYWSSSSSACPKSKSATWKKGGLVFFVAIISFSSLYSVFFWMTRWVWVCKIVATVPTAASSHQKARMIQNEEDKPLLLICSCSVRARQRQRWWGRPQRCWG